MQQGLRSRADGGEGQGGTGGEGVQARDKGWGGRAIKHNVNLKTVRVCSMVTESIDYSANSSKRWALRAHLKVVLLFCSLIKGERAFHKVGNAYIGDFLKVSVLGCKI